MNRLVIILTALVTGSMIYVIGLTGPLRNYLPDLLWGIGLVQTAYWMKEKDFQSFFINVLLFLPVATETGQLGILPGTFDIYDLLIYVVLVYAFFHAQIIQLCKKNQKHSSVA